MFDISLIDGWARVAIIVIGVVGAAFLIFGRPLPSSWWTKRLPLSVSVGVGAGLLAAGIVNFIWKPFADALPFVVIAAIAMSVSAIATAAARGFRHRRIVTVLAVLAVVLASVAQVNQHFGQYPTPRALLGLELHNQSGIPREPAGEKTIRASAGKPLSTVWKPTSDVDAHGTVATAHIPGTQSGFNARDAWIYFPPAYTADPHPLLPVLVMMAGQPGAPRDWLDGGKLQDTMDSYAASHNGLSPVVVIVDELGSQMANPICIDSAQGNVFTYLSKDVPDWIRSNLSVDDNPAHWAVGGLSSGGTCSLQLAVNAPTVYPTFVDISGESEPTIGTHSQTVNAFFGGNEAAFKAINPLDVIKTKHLPNTAGFMVAGRNDKTYKSEAQTVHAALTAAGIPVQYVELPGDHGWGVWGPGLAQSLPWLGQRLGLTP